MTAIFTRTEIAPFLFIKYQYSPEKIWSECRWYFENKSLHLQAMLKIGLASEIVLTEGGVPLDFDDSRNPKPILIGLGSICYAELGTLIKKSDLIILCARCILICNKQKILTIGSQE